MPHIEVDPEKQKVHLQKEIERRQGEATRIKSKLANPSFVERAPANVVEQDRARLADLEIQISKLQQQFDKLVKRG